MARQAAYDYLIKLLMIGDSGVGKSSLLLRFSDDSFTTSFITTIGIDFKIKTVEIDGKRVKLQIWDTAGQERFRTITTAYYRGAMGILLTYDITDEQSFLNVRNWKRNIEQHASESVEIILVGNKCDLNDDRIITKDRGQELAEEYGWKFFETSALTDSNVKDAFMTLARDIIEKKRNMMDNDNSNGNNGKDEINVKLKKTLNNNKFRRFTKTQTQKPMTSLEFPQVIITQNHLQMFDVEKSIYELPELKDTKKLDWMAFVKALLMLLFFPLSITYQTILFSIYNYGDNYAVDSLLPSDSEVSSIKSRINSDLLGIILFSDQTSFNLGGKNKSFSSATEFATKSNKQLCLRWFLVILCFAVYGLMWFAFFWYNDQTEVNISSSECIGPVVIFFMLVITVALWLSVETQVNIRSVDLESIDFHPLYFSAKYDNNDVEMRGSSKSTNIQKFLEIIREQPMKQKYDKLISILKIMFAVFYGLLSSFARFIKNEPFASDYVGIFIICVFNNIFLLYIVTRLCEITTTAAFSDVLAYFQAVTQILIPYKKRFIGSNHYLPYLNVKHQMNLPSWIQLRGCIYVRSMRRMVNVEIWMAMFILLQIGLCGAALYRLVETNEFDISDILSDSVFLSCVMCIILGCVYVFVVVWIGSLFHSLHQKQIRALSTQSSRIDYQLIKNNYILLQNEQDDVKEEITDSVRAEQTQRAIERTTIYLTQNDITPTVFGVRLDKVLRKSLIGVLVSVVTSVIAAYLNSAR